MKITVRKFQITKRRALTISRGASSGSENLLVEVEHDGIVGMGEMAPTSGGAVAETADSAESDILAMCGRLADVAPWEMQRTENLQAGSDGHAAAATQDANA